MKVRWVRDSYFQFLHMVSAGRPPGDGLYETEVTMNATSLAVGTAVAVPGDPFEAAITTPDP